MTNAALLQSLAETLLPGAGFFSGRAPLALNLDVNAKIDRLSIAIDAGQPEFLNIGAIRFMDMAGQEIDRTGIVRSAVLSSIYGETTPDIVHKRVLDGVMVHSRQELKPTLTIDLNEPIDVSRITIFNRNDFFGCRSRFLTLTATCAGDLAYSYVNFSSARQVEELQSLLAACGDPPLPEADALGTFVDEIRDRLRARIEANTFSWNPKRATQILPVLHKARKPSDFEITVAAHIVLSLLHKRNYLDTALLSPLQPVLNSDASIERMMAEINRILAMRGEPSKTLIIGKHRIQVPFLTIDKEKYLSALDKIFPLLESLGVKPLLCYGTLLGAVRERQFLLHDDDVDVLCIDGSQSREEALVKKQELIARLKQDGYVIRDTGENFHVQINQVGVDLFMSWQEGERFHLMMERFQYRHIDAGIMTPAASVQLYDRTYPAPADPAAFLQERYGDGWTVSDPFHEWPWQLTRLDKGQNCNTEG